MPCISLMSHSFPHPAMSQVSSTTSQISPIPHPAMLHNYPSPFKISHIELCLRFPSSHPKSPLSNTMPCKTIVPLQSPYPILSHVSGFLQNVPSSPISHTQPCLRSHISPCPFLCTMSHASPPPVGSHVLHPSTHHNQILNLAICTLLCLAPSYVLHTFIPAGTGQHGTLLPFPFPFRKTNRSALK